MNEKKIYELYDELNKDSEIKENLMVLIGTIESTLKFNLKELLKKAYRNREIKQAFDEKVDGVVIHFKLNKTGRKGKIDLENLGLIDKVKDAVKKVFSGKFKHFESFMAVISANKYLNIVCF